MTTVLDPASAVAAGLCITARLIAKGVTHRHPRTCGWCDWPLDELQAMVADFNVWAGYDERAGTYSRHEARVFQGLPRSEQQLQIVAAQAFEAVETPTPSPADEQEGPSWMQP